MDKRDDDNLNKSKIMKAIMVDDVETDDSMKGITYDDV